MTLAFKAHVQTLLQEHRGERVFCFEHLGKTFWLKQPEQLRGVWLLLKPHPKQAFLEEREILQQLNALDAPVPKLCDFGDDYMVLEDAGVTLNNWLNNDKLTWPQKEVILQTAIRALIAYINRELFTVVRRFVILLGRMVKFVLWILNPIPKAKISIG